MEHPHDTNGAQACEIVRCPLVDVQDLISMLPYIVDIRIERPGKRVTAGMRAIADCLRQAAALHHRQADGCRIVERLHQAISDGMDAVWRSAGAHPFAGVSGDGRTLVLVFADVSLGAHDIRLDMPGNTEASAA
jgi:hypothetical protein